MKSVPLTEAERRLRDLCTAATEGHQATQITRTGEAPVVLVSQADYDDLVRLRDAEDARRVAEGLADAGPRRRFSSGAAMLAAVGLPHRAAS